MQVRRHEPEVCGEDCTTVMTRFGHTLADNLCCGKAEQEESTAKDESALSASSRGGSHTGQVRSAAAGTFGDFALPTSCVMGFNWSSIATMRLLHRKNAISTSVVRSPTVNKTNVKQEPLRRSTLPDASEAPLSDAATRVLHQ